MGRKLGFLGFLACLCVFAFSANALADCAKVYYSCNSPYVLVNGDCVEPEEPDPDCGMTDCPTGYTDGPAQYDSCTDSNGSSTCYANCSVACSQSGCPSGVTCTYDTSVTSSGQQFLGGSCNATAVSCPIIGGTCSTSYSEVNNWECNGNECCKYVRDKTYDTSTAQCVYSEWELDHCEETEEPDIPTECDPGEYLDGDSCETCPANSYCNNNTQYSCSTETNGAYPYSASGSDDINDCRRPCTTNDVTNALNVSTAYYYYYNNNNQCRAIQCNSNNFYINTSGQCESCPSDCTCDGVDKSCTATCSYNQYVNDNNTCSNCGGGYNYSDGGQIDINGCYRQCQLYDVDHAVSVNTQSTHGGTPYHTSYASRVYRDGTKACIIEQCEEGYYIDGSSCVACSAGCRCEDGITMNCGCPVNKYAAYGYDDPESLNYHSCYSCSTANNAYPYSDGGFRNNSWCYKECDMAEHATAMDPNGRDYYNATDTCAATACETGYYLNSGVCTICPAGSYCDGTDKFNCPSTHPHSDTGNSSKNKCYADCPVVPPATAVSGRDYFGPNETDTCTITACEAGYYLVNGTCTICPEGSYCNGTDKFSCPSTHPHSDTGNSSKNKCYADCPVVPPATAVSGRDYFGPNETDTCTITACEAGYYPNAIGTECVLGSHDCVAGKTTTGANCPVGSYCPARQGIPMDESCEIQCPTDDGGGTVTSPSGSTLITQCQTKRTGVDLNDLDNGNASSGGGNMVCNYSENVGNVGYTDCGTIEIKYCYAGYYRAATDAIVCSKVGTGAWSPDPTNKLEDNASMSRYSCNDLQSGVTATTSGANAETSGLPTACYMTCPVENVYDSLNNIIGSRTANPDTVYFNGTITAYNPGPDQNGYGTVTVSGGFPACEYQSPVCNAGYHTVANTCESNIYTFTLNKNGGTGGDNGPIYMKYNVGWFADSGAATPITGVVLPTKTDGNCSGYAMDSTPVINANGEIVALSTLVNTADYTAPIQLDAGWAPKQTTTCDAGEYYSGQTDSCKPCEPGYWCPGGTTYSGPDSDGDDHFKNACPVATNETYTPAQNWNGTTLVNVAPNVTSAASSDEELDCYATVRYTATKGAGSQICHYAAGRYESNCETNSIQILTCDSGYYRANTNDTDCVAAGLQYYSGQYEITRTRCPDAIYDVDDSRNTILTDGPTSEFVTSCVQNGVWQDTPHGGRTTRCHYNETASDYSTNCDSYTMRICDAGYWDELNGTQTTDVNIDCVVVGEGNYSPAQSSCSGEPAKPTDILGCSTKRYACPSIDSYAGNANTDIASTAPATGTTTAASATACYIACIADKTTIGATLTVNNSPVHYNTTNGTYDMCTYDVHECLQNYVCNNDGVDSCSNLTNGRYPYSDAETGDVSYCYTNCTLPEHATAVSGRDYNGAPDTCQITCAAGYALENGQCVVCPSGSYCDGTPGDDGDGAELCSTLGDGSWMYSAPGSTSPSDCYRSCVEYTQDACLLVPVEAVAYWPNTCQYTATINGHPAELVDGDCALTGCLRGYKLVNGECEMCHVENAISYNLGGCTVETCVIGYHPNGEQCDPDIIDCTPQAPNATYAEQRWVASHGAYGICTIKNCEDGYHLASNACVANEQVCDIEHGTGMKIWNTTTNSWGPCIATSCAPGYTNIPVEKNNASQQCSECRNKFSTFGEVAAQAYITGCEIASCFYQGERYNLDNNECVPICDQPYSDETGSLRWNNRTKKCERTCNPGYVPW